MRICAAGIVALALLALAACGGSGAEKPKVKVVAGAKPAAPPPEADVVSGNAEGEQGKAPEEYWTAERMRNATPVDLISKPGKPQD
nr:hypothetical protein [Actinomycetota bacterium]